MVWLSGYSFSSALAGPCLAISSAIRGQCYPADAPCYRRQMKGIPMSTATLTKLLQIAGLLHIGLFWAGASMPKAVNLGAHLASLPIFIRRLFFVYFSFIGLVLAGFGCLTYVFASSIAAGEPVAR